MCDLQKTVFACSFLQHLETDRDAQMRSVARLAVILAATWRAEVGNPSCPLLGGWEAADLPWSVALHLEIALKTQDALAMYSIVDHQLLWNTYASLHPSVCSEQETAWSLVVNTKTDKMITNISEKGFTRRYLRFLNSIKSIQLSNNGKLLTLTSVYRSVLIFTRSPTERAKSQTEDAGETRQEGICVNRD
eukprot:Gregarina_sp_Poly_1__4469@NODE_2404_length_2175_cov_216_330171_g1531_i0_p2_GENE_NODE_2404_length_2175_cov_216_330171_g1531_i0NODE_2404_length_2175_cov_216_330171_g1531_i0_p2_ORF_typecomplete_len191_score18_29_NODE_2404_length_2175_cov_216_330171_g1531_i012781850